MSFLSGRTSLTTVQTGDLAADSVTSAKIADDAVDSEHYTDASVDLAHMSSQAVDEDNLHISNSGSNGQFLSKQSGDAGGLTWAAAGGGSWTLIGSQAASDSASLTQTGLTSTYSLYVIHLSDIRSQNNSVYMRCRLGDSSGIDSGSSDYTYVAAQARSYSDGAFATDRADDAAFMAITKEGQGNTSGWGSHFTVWLNRGDGTVWPSITSLGYMNIDYICTVHCAGVRQSAITTDRIQFYFDSGNIVAGRMSVWGVSHA